MQNNMFGLYDMFSGGNLSRVTIFALGIMPYISASIILQLLTVVWPYLEKLSKEGELGRRKITQYTRYGTIVLSVVQSLGIAIFLERQTKIAGGLPLVYNPGIGLPADDGADADHRHLLHHVAGRADYRTRHRQRHVADHLSPASSSACRARCCRRSSRCGPASSGCCAILFLLVFMVAGHRRHRVRRARAPARHGAIRQARGRAADVRRIEHAYPAQGQHRRRDPGDLRLVDSRVPRDDCAGVPRQVRRRGVAAARPRRCRSTTCCMSPASSSSRISTRRSSSTRMTSPRTCASTAASFRASGRASGRRSTSTRF